MQPGQMPPPSLPGMPGQTLPYSQTMPGQQSFQPGQPYQPQPFPGQTTPSTATPNVPQAIRNTIFGASSTSAFNNNPQPGSGSGMGTGIAGVGIPAEYKGEGIMVIKERTKYREWEFIYDPKEDKTIVGPAGTPQTQTPQNPLGPQTPPQTPQQPPQQPPQ